MMTLFALLAPARMLPPTLTLTLILYNDTIRQHHRYAHSATDIANPYIKLTT